MTFPSLIPSSRIWTPASYSVVPTAAGTGSEAREQTDTELDGPQLRLRFIGLSEADWLALEAHEEEVGIGWQPFALPASCWEGVSSQADYLPAGYGWVFAEPLDVEDYPCGGHDVAVTLTAVPLGAGVAPGADLVIRCSIQQEGVPVFAPGAALTVDVLLAGGGAEPKPAIAAPGASLTVAVTLSGGGAHGGYPGSILALNPTFFWDPSIDSTVTLSGSEIQSIADQGSRGWTLSKSTTGPQIYTDGNGRKWIDWGTAGHNNYLRNTTTTNTNIAEWYIVVDANFGSTFPGYNGLITATVDDGNPNEWFLTGTLSQAGFDTGGSNYNRVFINGSTTDGMAAVLPTINSPALLRIKRSDDAAVTLQSGVQLGNDRNNANRGWGGLVGAVVGFSAPLSSTNRATCESELAARFGVTI